MTYRDRVTNMLYIYVDLYIADMRNTTEFYYIKNISLAVIYSQYTNEMSN